MFLFLLHCRSVYPNEKNYRIASELPAKLPPELMQMPGHLYRAVFPYIWSNGKRIPLLVAGVFLVAYWQPPSRQACCDQQAARWQMADFDSLRPSEIIEYVTWTNDCACSFRQGRPKYTYIFHKANKGRYLLTETSRMLI